MYYMMRGAHMHGSGGDSRVNLAIKSITVYVIVFWRWHMLCVVVGIGLTT
jgi:hypothetical protein